MFTPRGIRSQKMKFASLVQALPPDEINEVTDLLENMPDTDPYHVLKMVIIKRAGRSDKQML